MEKTIYVNDFVIEKRHVINTDYADCSKCAASKAFREANPHLELKHMIWGQYYLSDNLVISSDKYFISTDFFDLKDGTIEQYKVTFDNYRKLQSDQEVQECDARDDDSKEKAGSIITTNEFKPVTYEKIVNNIPQLSNS